MQENWSLILNVLLLIGVVVTIGRLIVLRRPYGKKIVPLTQPSVGNSLDADLCDGIIATRRISPLSAVKEELITASKAPQIANKESQAVEPKQEQKKSSATSLLIFLQAKENRYLAGYELLQTVLAAGLRFGEGQLFHRHQHPNGQGPVLCSLAAATASGVFDLQNIGAFSVRGLCLFMPLSHNPTVDKERFTLMLDTAKQLAEGLDTYILDYKKRVLTEEGIQHYYNEIDAA